MGILNFFAKKQNTASPPLNTTPQKSEKHVITGLKHHKDSLMALAVENPNYKLDKKSIIAKKLTEQTIWQYDFNYSKVLLQEEPDNPYDPNAIQVIVDGRHIGYIKKGSCTHVKKILHSGAVTAITLEKLHYGEKKCVSECYEEGHFEIEKEFCNGYAVITISYNET